MRSIYLFAILFTLLLDTFVRCAVGVKIAADSPILVAFSKEIAEVEEVSKVTEEMIKDVKFRTLLTDGDDDLAKKFLEKNAKLLLAVPVKVTGITDKASFTPVRQIDKLTATKTTPEGLLTTMGVATSLYGSNIEFISGLKFCADSTPTDTTCYAPLLVNIDASKLTDPNQKLSEVKVTFEQAADTGDDPKTIGITATELPLFQTFTENFTKTITTLFKSVTTLASMSSEQTIKMLSDLYHNLCSPRTTLTFVYTLATGNIENSKVTAPSKALISTGVDILSKCGLSDNETILHCNDENIPKLAEDAAKQSAKTHLGITENVNPILVLALSKGATIEVTGGSDSAKAIKKTGASLTVLGATAGLTKQAGTT